MWRNVWVYPHWDVSLLGMSELFNTRIVTVDARNARGSGFKSMVLLAFARRPTSPVCTVYTMSRWPPAPQETIRSSVCTIVWSCVLTAIRVEHVIVTFPTSQRQRVSTKKHVAYVDDWKRATNGHVFVWEQAEPIENIYLFQSSRPFAGFVTALHSDVTFGSQFLALPVERLQLRSQASVFRVELLFLKNSSNENLLNIGQKQLLQWHLRSATKTSLIEVKNTKSDFFGETRKGKRIKWKQFK